MIPKLASLEEGAQLKERVNAFSLKCQIYVPYTEFSRLKDENAMVVSRVPFWRKALVSNGSRLVIRVCSQPQLLMVRIFKCKSYAVIWRVFVRKLIGELAMMFLFGAMNHFHMSLILFLLFRQQLPNVWRTSRENGEAPVMGKEGYMFVLVVNLEHKIVRMMRHHTLCKVHH